MFNRPARQRFPWWPLALVLVIGAVILVNTQFTDAPRDIASRVTLPLQRVLSGAGAGLREITGSFGDLATLRSRNAELEKSVAQLTVENLRLKEVEAENARLRKLLGFAQTNPSFDYKGGQIVGRVVGSEPNSIIQSIVIDLGKANGIEPGMPVVTERGLVGRVTDVYNNSLTSAADHRQQQQCQHSAAKLAPTRYLARPGWPTADHGLSAAGQQGSRGRHCGHFRRGGNFPAGVPVGQVVEVEQNDVEMFQRAVVRTTVDFDTLETILVVTNFKPLQEAIDLPDK